MSSSSTSIGESLAGYTVQVEPMRLKRLVRSVLYTYSVITGYDHVVTSQQYPKYCTKTAYLDCLNDNVLLHHTHLMLTSSIIDVDTHLLRTTFR